MLILGLPALAAAAPSEEQEGQPDPPDPIGGFVVGLLGGTQFVGSTSGQFGLTVSYFKKPAASFGLEIEGARTLGPSGLVYHATLSVVLQAGARGSKIVPFVAAGGGFYYSEVQLQDEVQQELPNFGVTLERTIERGPLINFGLGFRYFLSETLSIRVDYREFRALRESDESFFDRVFALRRIAGTVLFEF